MKAATRGVLWVPGLVAFALVIWWLSASGDDEVPAPAPGTPRAGAGTAPSFELPASQEQEPGAVPVAVAAEASPAAAAQALASQAPAAVHEIVLRTVDRAGQPLPTASIAIWRGLAEGSEVARAADESWPVDSSARFTLPIDGDHFVLEATDAVAGRSGFWNDRNLLRISRNGVLVTLRLQPPTHVVGRVVTAEDQPVPFATVHLEGGGLGLQRGQPHETASRCDGAGRFDLDCDTGVNVSLWATDEHDVMSNGEPMPTPSVELAIGDEAPPEVTLRFPPRLLVEGRLIDAITGAGMQGQVAVWRPDEATKEEPDWGSIVTDKDGHFAIRFFSAGAEVLRGHAHAGGASVPREIVLPEGGGSVVVDLLVDPPLPIEGQVVDVSGQVISDAQVYANWYSKSMPGQSANANTRSLADGTFVLTPPDPHGLYDIGAGYPEVNLAQRLLEAVPAGTRGLRLVLPMRPTLVAVHGRILAADTREPAAGVKAILWTKQPAGGGSVGKFLVVDADGNFDATGIPDGSTISVQAHATDYGRSQSAWIEAGAEKPPIEVWLEHRGALSVQARDGQGHALAGAELRVESSEHMQGHDSWRLSTDELGVARLADLDAGTYVVSLRDAVPPVEARADVLPGRETAVDIALAQGPP